MKKIQVELEIDFLEEELFLLKKLQSMGGTREREYNYCITEIYSELVTLQDLLSKIEEGE